MRALADFFYTLSWRIPGRTWRRLYSFALAEAESALELRCAAALTPDPALAAKFLRHAEDEERHARILVRRAELARGSEPLSPPRPSHEHLYRELGEEGFLAFVLRGETRGRRQFEAHVRHFESRDAALARALSSILEDERRHESYTRALVMEPSAQNQGARQRARWRDRLYRWRSLGSAFSAPLFVLTMGLLYVLTSPLALLSRPKSGWRESE